MRSICHSSVHHDLVTYRFERYLGKRCLHAVHVFRAGQLMVDTAHSRSRRCLMELLDDHPPASILITHHHEDHAGNAAFLKRRLGVRVLAHQSCADLLAAGPSVSPVGRLLSGTVQRLHAVVLQDAQVLDLEGHRVAVYHTPGHTPDHAAYHFPDRGWLFSGDLYVSDRIKYFEDSECIDQQIESLERLAALDFDMLLCSHSPVYQQGKTRLLRKLELMRAFYGEAAHLYHQGIRPTGILAAMGRKERYFFKYFSLGRYSAVNMVHSVIRAERRKAAG